LLLCSFVHQGTGAPSNGDGQPTHAFLQSFQFNPALATTENPDYFAVLSFKFSGNFDDGSVLADVTVLDADPAGPLKEECRFREKSENNTVLRFDRGHEFVVGDQYVLKRPNNGDTVDIIDDDGGLTYLALCSASNKLQEKKSQEEVKKLKEQGLYYFFRPFQEMAFSFFTRKCAQDPALLLSNPRRLGNFYYEAVGEDKPEVLRRIDLGSGVTFSLDVKELCLFLVSMQVSGNSEQFLALHKSILKMPFVSYPQHQLLIKRLIPGGQPLNVEVKGVDNTKPLGKTVDFSTIDIKEHWNPGEGFLVLNEKKDIFDGRQTFEVKIKTEEGELKINPQDTEPDYYSLYLTLEVSQGKTLHIGPVYYVNQGKGSGSVSYCWSISSFESARSHLQKKALEYLSQNRETFQHLVS
jgi:hypothetical protein